MDANDAKRERPTTAASSEESGLWAVADVATFLRVSKSWVYQAAASGTLPCIRLGALLRFEADTLRAWVRGEHAGKAVTLPGCRK
jgi:excisionase family DNA binding protein